MRRGRVHDPSSPISSRPSHPRFLSSPPPPLPNLSPFLQIGGRGRRDPRSQSEKFISNLEPRSKMSSTIRRGMTRSWREMRLSLLLEGALLDKGVRFAGGGRRREMMSPQGMANLMTADWLCMGYMNGWPLLP